MKVKIIFVLLLIIALAVTGCMRPDDVRCNYDGVCDDWETDNCPDCVDVLGRGVPIPPSSSDDDLNLS